MCYRCALVIQDVKVPQTVIDSDPIFETNKKDRTLPLTEIQIDQLETLAQDGMPNKSQSLSSFSISRNASNYSIAEYSGYKEIFKEIFLILHNAHNA